ncbi:MAG TPA: M13 family metallopeptidase [Vicinamibacteria bacterium]|nr:M13 family metallopeptidase [Vicinamibacteria bacterium]
MRNPLAPIALATLALAGAAAAQDGRFSVSSLDRSVDPCVDFYAFACGGWRRANPIPPDQTRWGRFNELAERNREELHLVLERAKDPGPGRTPIEAEVGDYYAACMDEAAIEAKGLEPIRPALARVGAISSKKAFFRLLGEHEAEALPAVFRFGSAPDMHDSRRTVANVGQGGLGLPDRDDYLKDDAKSKEKRERYAEHVARLLELAGATSDDARRDAETVLRVETGLARAHLSRVEMRDPKNRDNPMSVEELAALAPAFEWSEYLPATGAPAFTRLNVSSRKFFAETSALVEATPLEDWKTYLRWHVVEAAAPFLGRAFAEEDFRFNRAYLQGAKEIEPRWKRCVQSTDRALGDALGQLYVERTFGADGKARMARMIEAITAAMREDIETLGWMTPETKKKALAKLDAFGKGKVGYPDQWKDYRTVEIRRDDYYGDARRARVFEVKREQARIDRPTDRTLWGMTPATVNAYYNAANNEIVFPAGILRPPFFDREADDALNFGGIGVVIGHEYTHGFDDQGSKFDPDGNFANWWTDADRKAFEERTGCIAQQYEGYVSVKDAANGDVHLNGRLTLGENTADNGGLRVAYLALQKALAGRPQAKIDGFTLEQRFFLGFANVWCQNVTEEAARQLAQNDSHSPGEFRVNGSVGNTPEFAQAFGCRAGQPMVRENACRAW